MNCAHPVTCRFFNEHTFCLHIPEFFIREFNQLRTGNRSAVGSPQMQRADWHRTALFHTGALSACRLWYRGVPEPIPADAKGRLQGRSWGVKSCMWIFHRGGLAPSTPHCPRVSWCVFGCVGLKGTDTPWPPWFLASEFSWASELGFSESFLTNEGPAARPFVQSL